MNAAFLAQWRLYRRGAPRPPVVGLAPRTDSAFDAGVTPGEVRVFADTNRPLVALVVADRGLSGWRIVPESPFCAPASGRELAVGGRVLQLWNATTVSRRFAERSWRVGAVSPEELAEVVAAIPSAHPGRLVAGDGVQARYEREFLVGEGTLVPLARPRAAGTRRAAWLRASLLAAASLALCLAAWHVTTADYPPRVVRAWRDTFRTFRVDAGHEPIELADGRAAPGEVPGADEAAVEIEPPGIKWFAGREPDVVPPRRFADVKGPRMPPELAKSQKGAIPGGGYRSPVDSPMRVVFLSSAESPSRGGPPAPLSAAPRIGYRIDGSAGPREGAVLTIEGEAFDGVKVTVRFDPGTVACYREIVESSVGSVRATYELVAAEGKAIGEGSVEVSVIWPSPSGDLRASASGP